MVKNIILTLLLTPFLLSNHVLAEEENTDQQLSISKIIIKYLKVILNFLPIYASIKILRDLHFYYQVFNYGQYL